MLAGVDYIDALLYINSLADYEKHADPATHRTTFNLVRIGYLCEQLGRPQDTYASVHIAGTKGKGSVAAMIQRAAMAGGLRAGLYTSPHLHTLGERIRVNRHMVSEEEIAALTEEVAAIVERLHAERPEIGRVTTFELLTAMALRYFAQRKVDVAVLETGLGGRLDATNVVMPLVAVITSISLDHTKILGGTLEAI
nr:Mur ligase family protein [Dehalococcoidales bacterium]